ncbi:MAG: serine/threonine protein kinase [Bacteroidetes bacterium]|nr:serine/threonine protein kinase [Bacteroidota bacterium]
MQYILSKYFEIFEIEENPENQLEGFLLENERTSISYVINQEIKTFLDAFREAKSLKQVMSEFAATLKCQADQLEDVMSRFLNQMLARGVLVENGKEEVGFTDQLIKQGQVFSSLEVITPLALKSKIEIHLCNDLKTDEQVILKVLKIEDGLSEGQKEHKLAIFRQEFSILHEVKEHPNICGLFRYDESPSPHAVLEFIKGKRLKQYNRKYRPDLNTRINLLTQVFDAVAYCHSKRILHGDIHCSNFLVTAEEKVKLIDFGMSNHEVPKKGEILIRGGVLKYIPPEKINKNSFDIAKDRSDYRSEVYQLGVVAFAILYDDMPYRAETWFGLADKILSTELQLPSTTKAGESISPSLISVMEKTLQKNPLERYASAQELVTDWKKKVKTNTKTVYS